MKGTVAVLLMGACLLVASTADPIDAEDMELNAHKIVKRYMIIPSFFNSYSKLLFCRCTKRGQRCNISEDPSKCCSGTCKFLISNYLKFVITFNHFIGIEWGPPGISSFCE